MSKSTKTSSCRDALSAITKALEAREKNLAEHKAKVQRDREALDAEQLQVYGERGEPTDVLHLNVGGVKVTTLRKTLTTISGSMLASKFSGRWDDNLEKDRDGNFFIDQDYSLFEPVLNYLRNKANENIEEYPMSSPTVGRDQNPYLYRMIEYYGMTSGIFPTQLEKLET
eukprot:jgi/Psemu1/289182/fgenesh1_pg.332_\